MCREGSGVPQTLLNQPCLRSKRDPHPDPAPLGQTRPAHQGWTQPAGPRVLLYSAAMTSGAAGLAESICHTLLSARSAEPTAPSSPRQSHTEQGCALPPLQPAPCSTSRPLLWHIPLSGDTGGNSDIPSVMPGKGNSKNTVPLPPAPPAPHSQHSPLSSSTL